MMKLRLLILVVLVVVVVYGVLNLFVMIVHTALQTLTEVGKSRIVMMQ